jgi:Flp pilus assembly protein TadD
VRLWIARESPEDREKRRWFWREQEADNAEAEQRWFAAAFHLGQLLKDKPNDPDLNRRRGAALDKLNRVADGQAPLRMDKLPAP